MATAVIMPRQGNSVESCLIAAWKKAAGETVAAGEVLVEIETDKATMEVEAPASGTVLEIFFPAGADVPVLTNIAAIGQPGEAINELRPAGAAPAPQTGSKPAVETAATPPAATDPAPADGRLKISPRARKLADHSIRQIDVTQLRGSGPGGRIIERDVQAAIAAQPAMTPLARTMVASGAYQAPGRGSGVSGRVMAEDLSPVGGAAVAAPAAPSAGEEIEVMPLKGIRKVIAGRMLESLQSTAQLTLNAFADARALQAYRQQLKQSDPELGLQGVSINDLVLLAVSRTLPHYPALNALFIEEAIHQYRAVHLGVAVDTPRGLMVPTIRQANSLSLKQLASESKRLAAACLESKISPDELSGGTFTVTNLGALGIETFTPVLNPPQVAILGVGNIHLKPVELSGQVEFIPHLGLSLTINHQVVDGAPAARFLQALSRGLANIQLLTAL